MQSIFKDGKEAGSVTLPEAVFGEWNRTSSTVVVGMQANAREGTAHTKIEVKYAVVVESHGDRREQVARDTVHDVHRSGLVVVWLWSRNEKDYSVKINKKVKAKALASVLSKAADEEVIFVDSLAMEAPKIRTRKQLWKHC